MAVTLHVILILIAFAVSFFIIFGTKGTRLHRYLGWVFTISMFVSAVASFWIPYFGKFSPIHILSVFTIYWLIRAIVATRLKRPNWKYIHAMNMGSAYIGILIAGVGVLFRHYVDPGNVALGGIASLVTWMITGPILIMRLQKHKVQSSSSS
jgi:uncharacterized membrane protein